MQLHWTRFAVLWSLSLLARLSLGQQLLGQTQTGVATFYGGPQDNTSPYVASFGLLDGSCGYGTLQQNDWPFWQAAAISPTNPLATGGNKKGCGACIQATCTAGCMATATPLVVLVTDTCDTCGTTQINIHSLAFQKNFNSDLVVGRVTVQWQQVACAPPGDIKAKVVDYRVANGGFIAIALLSVAGDGVIANMEIQSSGTSIWVPMTNDHGAVWQASNLGSAPFGLRITGSSRQQLTAPGAITAFANGTYPTGVQFGGLPSASPPQQQAVAASSQPVSSGQPPAASTSASPGSGQIPQQVPVVVAPPRVSPPQAALVPPPAGIVPPPAAIVPPAAAISPPSAAISPSPAAIVPPAAAISPPPAAIVPPAAPISPPPAVVAPPPAALVSPPPPPPAVAPPQVAAVQPPAATPPSAEIRPLRPSPAVAPTEGVVPSNSQLASAQSSGPASPPVVLPGASAPTPTGAAARPASTLGAPAPVKGVAEVPAPQPAPRAAAVPLAAPRPAPKSAKAPAPALAEPGAPSSNPPAVLASAPGTTQLTLNTSLDGTSARAGEAILNPAISVSAGRKLHSAARMA